MSFLNKKSIKEFCKTKKRRVSKEFMASMERTVEYYLSKACETHNGDKLTLDNSVASYVGMKLDFTAKEDSIGLDD